MAFMDTYIRLKNKIKTFNLFENIEKTEEEDLKNQKISTWILLILLFLSILSLLVYASLTNVTKTVAIQQPQITVYKKLQSKYPNTLVCPCQQILNAYNTFIVSFIPKFNQICSSDFVGEQWLNYVNYRLLPQLEYHYIFDFRHSAYSFFQTLRTLCVLVSQTINDQLIQFYATTLLTETLLSEDTFLATILASKDQFLNMTASSLKTAVNSLRTIIQADQIVNRLELNFYIENTEYEGQWSSVLAAYSYPPDGCSCEVSSYCHTTTSIFTVVRKDQPSYEYPDYPYMPTIALYEIHSVFRVPGINVGCFILDAVLQSDLACLYDNSCLSQLNTYLNDSLHPFNASSLNVSYSSLPTVNNLVDNLMVDEWLFNSSYESYFSQCNPSSCAYTYTTQFDPLFIITTVTGSIGGIVTILMLTILPLVSFTRRFVCRHRRLSITQSEADARNPRSVQQDFQSFPLKIHNFAITLNFFKDPLKKSDHDLKNQQISTRLFIVSVFITLSVLVLYTSLAIVTNTVTIKQPTVNVFIEQQTKYSQTLVCPCTQISINYEDFISFHPTFHQICSSDFINAQWLDYLTTKIGKVSYSLDLRNIGSTYFSTLSAFCNLSAETINNSLLVFNSTKYITKNVQQTDLFRSQIGQIINLFKQTTTNSYLQELSVGRQIISGNALFSGLLTNYGVTTVNDSSSDLEFNPYHYHPDAINVSNISCSCKYYPSTCGELSGIYSSSVNNLILLFSIPGFWFGCYTIESLFGSTLECYFNQSCIDTIYRLTAATSSSPFNATALIYNSSNTQYNITTKLQHIIEQLMIEQWNEQISFNSYFKQCNPVVCLYTYNKQGDLAYIFTTTIALIGGLTTVLKILIPPIVAFLRRKKRLQSIETEVDDHEQRPNLVRKYTQILKSEITMLNFFKNPNKRLNEQIQRQRISTRIFIILFSLSLIVLCMYVSLENVTQTITIKNPSIDQFNLLYQQYSDSLQCPCKTLSIEYQNFIQFDPQFHSICASDFLISRTWLEIDYSFWEISDYDIPNIRTNIDDYRQIASPLFQLLSSFCQLSLQTLNTELLTFNFTTFITQNLISPQQFKARTSQIISQFMDNTARSFMSTLQLVNNMTFTNMLISALSSDSVLTMDPQYYYDYYGYLYEYVYDRTDQHYNSTLTGVYCDCQENPFCIQQAVVYDLDATTVLFPVPGIYVGCYLATALLQSDLRCFYDDLCLQELMNSLYISSNISSLLNSTSIYEVTTTVQEIISNLMIEQWNNQTSYQDYFNECQPDECSVTYVHRRNVAYIITTMTGLIGGLTKIYLFAVPLLVTAISYIVIRLKRKRIINITVVPLETTEREANGSV